ncbi:hypothetical protein PMIN05_009775 [Paraphaeosphaeria minitans]
MHMHRGYESERADRTASARTGCNEWQGAESSVGGGGGDDDDDDDDGGRLSEALGRRAAELELAWAVVKEAGAAERPLISVLQKESTGITQGAGHRIYSECPMAHRPWPIARRPPASRSCLPRVAWAVPGRDVQRHAVFVVGDHLCLLTPVLPSAHASAMLLTTPPADASAIRSSPACIVSLFWAHAGVAVFHVDTPA